MSRVTAILDGGDWYDASVDFLVLPDGMDLEAEAAAHRRWYVEEYCDPRGGVREGVRYQSFESWLKARGARDPNDDELQIVDNR